MATEALKIEVILAEAARCQRVIVEVCSGATARQTVLEAQRLGLDFSGCNVDAQTAALGVYAELVSDDYVLADGDRLEIYRPLAQDPMELRRRRAKQAAAEKKQVVKKQSAKKG